MKIRPVILAGGSGVRLWPLSREAVPKQLLALVSERSLLQETLLRVHGGGFLKPIVICNEQYRFLIAEQMRAIGIEDALIVLEPVGRNSAAAAAVGAIITEHDDRDALMLMLPSDHVMRDVKGFRESVATAAHGAKAERLMTFGVKPTHPAVEYGYIRGGEKLALADGCAAVAEFVEKPDKAKAEKLLAAGGYAWNSGMFMFMPSVFLAELGVHEPMILQAARAGVDHAKRDLDFLRLDGATFSASPNISIDYAVMERTKRAGTCPLCSDWSDLGSWAAIWEASTRDGAGNVVQGDVILKDAQGCLVRSEGALTTVVGLRDAIVVTTDDAVLVAAKDQAQNVRAIVDQLKAAKRKEAAENTVTHRPWGKFENIDKGERYQVKLITVKPGASLSLQMHHHRSEHWIVVNGTGKVTRGDETFLLHANESTFIPLGTRHRLENPGDVPLELIEVQSGSYLGEDDIVRFDDKYGRVPAQ